MVSVTIEGCDSDCGWPDQTVGGMGATSLRIACKLYGPPFLYRFYGQAQLGRSILREESPLVMLVPLIVIGSLSVAGGWLNVWPGDLGADQGRYPATILRVTMPCTIG